VRQSATSALSRVTAIKETPETAVGEDRRDYETTEVDQGGSEVASMGQWCSVVGAGVEQGRQHHNSVRECVYECQNEVIVPMVFSK
jgi:hypothetical protein